MAALQAAIASAQAHLQETEDAVPPLAGDSVEGGEPDPAQADPARARSSVAAGKSADEAAVAAAAADPSAPGPVPAEWQPNVAQGVALASDGAAGNLPSAGAAAAATSSASVAAAVASDLG